MAVSPIFKRVESALFSPSVPWKVGPVVSEKLEGFVYPVKISSTVKLVKLTFPVFSTSIVKVRVSPTPTGPPVLVVTDLMMLTSGF